MECVLRSPAKARWIAERPDNLHELHKRTWPSVRESYRQRIGVGRPHVNEMNAEPVDSRAVLREGVDASLEPAHVVPIAPIGNQGARLLQGNALRPVTNSFPLRPPRGPQTAFEVVNCALRH